MGLLDKVDNIDEEKPAKAKAAKAVAKAKPKAAKAVAKAKPAKAAKPAKPAKAAKAKKAPKKEKLRPTGLPEGYELAGGMPRYIGWLINFACTNRYALYIHVRRSRHDNSIPVGRFDDSCKLASNTDLDW